MPRTLAFVREHLLVECVFLLVVYVLGLIVHQGGGVMTLLVPLAAAALLLLASLGWNLVSAPARLEQVQTGQAEVLASSSVVQVGQLVEEGDVLLGRVELDRLWDAAMCDTAVQGWVEKVARLLRDGWPEYLELFQNSQGLPQPDPPSHPMGPTEAEARRAIAAGMTNQLVRLRDINDRIEAREGVEAGRRRAEWLRFKDLLLPALLVRRELRERISSLAIPVQPMEPVDPREVEAEVEAWWHRLRALLAAALGDSEMERLMAVRPPYEQLRPNARDYEKLNLKIGIGELAIFELQSADECVLLPGFDPQDSKWSNYF